ncbi:UDP-N-acetylmuramate dehydrogenase [Desulfovibrio litoralis]|nr:UDP-N-acetylmuramate dehydrogenase [Desulfovibrio litoralis]
MSKLTSLKLGGRAIAELVLTDENDVFLLPDLVKKFGVEVKAIGRGTNILCRDSKQLLPFVLLRSNFNTVPFILKNNESEQGDNIAFVKVSASCKLPVLLSFFARNNLSGLEGLAGVPGNVGGAVAMNAGSYGDEIAKCLHSVMIFSFERGLEVLEKADFECSYRSFKIKQNINKQFFMILNAVFKMNISDKNSITAKMQECLLKKHQTQPVKANSAGCLFKNPVLNSAGKLLDEAGFRGKELGGMAFSELHANFLINKGEGTSEQAFELIGLAKDEIKKRYNIELETEVKIFP